MRICPACAGALESKAWACPACGWRGGVADGIPLLGLKLPEEGEGFSRAFFRELVELEAGNFWFKARNELILWAFQARIGRAASFLEVGCGTGFVLQAIRERVGNESLTGSDLFVEGLCVARERLPGVELLQMDATAMPFKEAFDAVGAFDVLEHIEEDERALAGLFRALVPGGHLLLTVPQHRWLWSVNDEHACHQRRYSRSEIRRKVRMAGFQEIWTTSFVALLLPALVLSRFRRNLRTTFDPLEEFRIPEWQQRILGTVLALERGLIKAGLRLPWGGSLFLLARKPIPPPGAQP